MNEYIAHQSGDLPLDEPLLNYAHISMMLSIPSDPREVFKVINESAADLTLSDVDRQIEALCERYYAAPEEQRHRLRKRITNGWSLLHYAHRMAVRAMRTTEPRWIRLGLISLVLEYARSDPRETIECLAMLRHAALHISTDFAALAGEAAQMATPGMAHCIDEFLSRKPEFQSLSAFSLQETQDANGPRIDVGLFPRRNTGMAGRTDRPAR